MKRHIVLLRPLGPQAGPILSHTIFGATCWALAALGKKVKQMLAAFDTGGPRFAFSGAYPYIRDYRDQLYLLLPRPPFRIPAAVVKKHSQLDTAAGVDAAKTIQKSTYISPGVADKLRSGRWKPEDIFEHIMTGQLVIRQSTLLLKREANRIWRGGEETKLWERVITQRNAVDRLAGATVEGLLFQQEEIFYHPRRSGLWFAVWADNALWPDVQAAFRFIADTGLGGKRSIGKGQFEFHISSLRWDNLFPPLNAERFLNLAHYIPSAPGESTPQAYDLDLIHQKVEHRYPDGPRRVYIASLRAFKPGGIFSTSGDGDLYGRLLELGTVGHRTVYYDGLTIPLWGHWEV